MSHVKVEQLLQGRPMGIVENSPSGLLLSLARPLLLEPLTLEVRVKIRRPAAIDCRELCSAITCLGERQPAQALSVEWTQGKKAPASVEILVVKVHTVARDARDQSAGP